MNYAENRPVNRKKVGGWIALVGGVVLLIVIISTLSVIVPVGHTGVVVSMGSVSETVLPEGFHIKAPWQNIVFIDNRTQKSSLYTPCFSSDIQQVDVSLSVNFSVDRETSQRLYKTVGIGYYNTLMLPRIMENTKSTFSQYTAENLIGSREKLSNEIRNKIAADLKPYGIEVLSIAVEDIDFTDIFTNAVEAKQVAEQTLLKTQTEQREMLLIEQNTADRAKIKAAADAAVAQIDADAKAYAIRAQAEAEAESNVLLAKSITQELIDYVQANNWDGALPKLMMGGSDAVPVISMMGVDE
ncbi:MAG: prohibitin family protein, partial [Clostridia bacterium]|nr:prohibitin family protein [Clostridia bacterium]